LYSFDPNNIPIEFSAPVNGVDLRREPRMADAKPIPAAEEGPEPRPRHWPPVEHPTPVDARRIYPGEGQHLFARGDDDDMHPV
jgi:hypothetical protein